MENNELTLNDLRNKPQDDGGLRKVDISQIAPKKEPEHSRSKNQQVLGSQIDAALERCKKEYIKELQEEQEKINEVMIEQEINKDSEYEMSDELKDIVGDVVPLDLDEYGHIKTVQVEQPLAADFTDTISNELEVQKEDVERLNNVTFEPKQDLEKESIKAGDSLDLSDFSELDLEDEEKEMSKKEDDNIEEELKEFSKDLAVKLNPISKPLDLNSVTVLKKPLAISNALLDYSKSVHVSDWVLYADSQSFSMESFTATEIDEIDARQYGQRNRYNTFLDIYGKMFNKIPGLNKKVKLEQWLKTLNFFSLNDLWFGVYKASFEKSNIVPYECPHCHKTFLREPSIMSMVKYKDKKVEDKFNKIFNGTKGFEKAEYPVRRIQISDKFVVDLREPSLWNVVFENAILEDKFRQKYASLLTTITYIDAMYVIRAGENGEQYLQEIQPKSDPENMLKHIKYRVYTYAKLLQTITSDERSILKSYIDSIIESHDEVAYQIPETTCEHCKKQIEAVEKSAEELLFTRQGLADMANFSQK